MAGSIMKKYQRHHTNFIKPEWNTHDIESPKGRMRRHPALIVPAQEFNHRLLHRMMDSTPQPTDKVAKDLLRFLPSHHNVPNRTLAFASAADFLLNASRTHHSEVYAQSAYNLGAHYTTQLGYLAMQEEAAQLMLMNIILETEEAA